MNKLWKVMLNSTWAAQCPAARRCRCLRERGAYKKQQPVCATPAGQHMALIVATAQCKLASPPGSDQQPKCRQAALRGLERQPLPT